MTPHACLTEFLTELELVGPEGQSLAIEAEVMSTGGTWLVPPEGDNGTSHLVEISLYTIPGRGATPAEAVADWTRAAHCMARHLQSDQATITPPCAASIRAASIRATDGRPDCPYNGQRAI